MLNIDEEESRMEVDDVDEWLEFAERERGRFVSVLLSGGRSVWVFSDDSVESEVKSTSIGRESGRGGRGGRGGMRK